MLITELNDKYPEFINEQPKLGDLQQFYQAAKKRFDSEPEFQTRAKERVVMLQGGDPDTIKAWKILCELSRNEFQQIYDRLDIRLEERGESFYNPYLKGIVDDLQERGFIKDSEGAKCMFIPKQKTPLMVQKSDGGYNYDTTDMACIRYRVQEQGANWLIYVTDSGQELHFKLIFEAGKMVGYYDPALVRIDHVGFGLVL